MCEFASLLTSSDRTEAFQEFCGLIALNSHSSVVGMCVSLLPSTRDGAVQWVKSG